MPHIKSNYVLQDFDREMSRGLKRAQAMQGGGDREGPIMVLESEVSPVCLIILFFTLL